VKSRRLVAAVSATAIAFLSTGTAAASTSVPAAATATTARPARVAPAGQAGQAAPASGAPDYRRACAPPKPGQAACPALVRTGVISRPTAGPGVTPFGYAPLDLWKAYNIVHAAQHRGRGRTVAIVDPFDDPNAQADLDHYRRHARIFLCTGAHHCFRKVNVNGSAARSTLPAPNASWAEEISSDVDMVSAICPLCHILLVEAPAVTLVQLGKAVNTAVRMGA
jgi:hypothetical protein